MSGRILFSTFSPEHSVENAAVATQVDPAPMSASAATQVWQAVPGVPGGSSQAGSAAVRHSASHAPPAVQPQYWYTRPASSS